MGCGASRSDTHSPSAQPPTAPVQPPPTAVAAAPSKKQLIPPPQPTSSSSKPAKSHPSFTGGPTFVDDLDGIGPSHTSTFGALERKDSNVTTSRRSRASSATSNAARSRSSSALGSRDEVDVAAPLTTAKGLQRASTFTTNGDVFAKLLAERQAQAAASLKSPYLDPNEFSLDLPSADEPVVDLTPLIAGKVSDVRRVQSTLDARVSRSSTEADVTAIEALEKSLSAAKQELLHILTSAPPSISVSGRVVTDQLVALCTDLVQGNEDKLAVELFSMLLRKLGLALRLGDLAFQRAWCHYAAKDGKPRFLVYILQLPGVCAAIANQPTELLHLAVKHERARIPLVQTLLRFAIPLGLHKRKGELEPFWEDFVDTVASCRRVKHIEDQTGRLALVQYLCTTPDVVRVNHERHRKDGLNVFLRACRDGDVDVVDLLLSKGLVTDVNERAKDRDGSTALVLAAMGGHKAVVESLLKTGRVDVLLKVKDKTAYVLAQENFKNPLLIALLRKAQREAEPHASGRETASGASSRRHSVNTSPAAVSVDIPTHPGDASPDFSNLLDATTTIPSPAPKALDPPTNRHDEHDHAELPPSYERGASPALPSVMELFQQLNAAYQKHDMGASEASSVALLRLRQDLASRLSREPSVKVPSASKTLVTDVLDRVVEHGDLEVGATELLRAAALHLDAASFDFRTIADKQEWPLMAARNNSPVMLSILLPAMGELSEETASNVIIAASKSESRLEMVKVLLDNARTWRRQRGTLLPLWQQFFENIGFTTGSSVQEETQKRFTTLDRILKCKDIEIAFEREDPDGYTMFARACAYGELELIEFMIDRRVLTDPNKALSDGTNPLLQAVAGDHVEVVELLLKYKVVDAASFLPGIGTALDAAVRLKRHHRIVDCLRAALGLTSAHHGSGPVPSGTGGRGSRRGSMRLIQ